jgi:hypothetical protein
MGLSAGKFYGFSEIYKLNQQPNQVPNQESNPKHKQQN